MPRSDYPLNHKLGEIRTLYPLGAFPASGPMLTRTVTIVARLQMFRGAANAGLYFLTEAAMRGAGSQPTADIASTGSARSRPATVHDPSPWRATPHSAALDLPLSDDSESEDSQPDTVSTVSTLSSSVLVENDTPARVTATGHLPAFSRSSHSKRGSAHMIRQRVSVRGLIRALEPPEELPGCTMRPEDIGRLHAVPVRKWLKQRQAWDDRYAKDLAHWRQVKLEDRVRAEQGGFLLGQFRGEHPPLGSVAGWHDPDLARKAASSVDEAVGKKTSASMALAMWSNISGKPDEAVVGGSLDSEPNAVDKVAEGLGRVLSLGEGSRRRSNSHATAPTL